jgi:hypothetical protein
MTTLRVLTYRRCTVRSFARVGFFAIVLEYSEDGGIDGTIEIK